MKSANHSYNAFDTRKSSNLNLAYLMFSETVPQVN